MELEKYQRNHILSKSTFVQAKQCTKLLYLNKNKRKEKKDYSKQTKVLFSFGKQFEADFRNKFDNGIHLTEILGNKFHYYAAYTEELLASKGDETLFEAGIIYDDVLVLTDVLQQNENGSYTIYEIKFANKLKPVFIWDLAVQYYVCKNKLQNIESFNVVLKGKKGKFRILNVTDLLEKQLEKISKEVVEFKKVLNLDNAPEVKIGSQCFRPYECPFMDYCRK